MPVNSHARLPGVPVVPMPARKPPRNGAARSRKTTRAAAKPRVKAKARTARPTAKRAKATTAQRAKAKPRATARRTTPPAVTVMPVSRLFQPFEKQAEEWAQDPARLLNLVHEAREKASAGRKRGLKRVWSEFDAITRLVESHAQGQATTVPWTSLVLGTAALLYVVSPNDFVPDWTQEGLGDDAAVIGMVASTIETDLAPYLQGGIGRRLAAWTGRS
jgi:uncharacterized membrane protein YkvA (DUF1232 family)